MDKIIIVSYERCMGCHSCELACAVEHSDSKDLVKAIYTDEKPATRIILETTEEGVVPMHCRHCEDAPCIMVCPSGAITRANEESPVILDQEKCIGCHSCIIVCPFGVIQKGKEGKSFTKCDFCAARLKANQSPACVLACPTKSIQFTEVSEVSAAKRKKYFKQYKTALSQEKE